MLIEAGGLWCDEFYEQNVYETRVHELSSPNPEESTTIVFWSIIRYFCSSFFTICAIITFSFLLQFSFFWCIFCRLCWFVVRSDFYFLWVIRNRGLRFICRLLILCCNFHNFFIGRPRLDGYSRCVFCCWFLHFNGKWDHIGCLFDLLFCVFYHRLHVYRFPVESCDCFSGSENLVGPIDKNLPLGAISTSEVFHSNCACCKLCSHWSLVSAILDID